MSGTLLKLVPPVRPERRDDDTMGVAHLLQDMGRDMKFLVTIIESRSIHWWNAEEEKEMKAWVQEIKGRYVL